MHKEKDALKGPGSLQSWQRTPDPGSCAAQPEMMALQEMPAAWDALLVRGPQPPRYDPGAGQSFGMGSGLRVARCLEAHLASNSGMQIASRPQSWRSKMSPDTVSMGANQPAEHPCPEGSSRCHLLWHRAEWWHLALAVQKSRVTLAPYFPEPLNPQGGGRLLSPVSISKSLEDARGEGTRWCHGISLSQPAACGGPVTARVTVSLAQFHLERQPCLGQRGLPPVILTSVTLWSHHSSHTGPRDGP